MQYWVQSRCTDDVIAGAMPVSDVTSGPSGQGTVREEIVCMCVYMHMCVLCVGCIGFGIACVLCIGYVTFVC